MPSRGRPRKPRLTRMHAAIDAMMQYGFSEDLVRTRVKELLEAYGGDDGWIFIEDNAYKELLEAVLRHTEPIIKPEENEEIGKSLESDPSQKENGEKRIPADSVGPSKAVVVADTEKDSSAPRECHPSAEEDGKGWKDIELDQVSGRKKIMANDVVGNTLDNLLAGGLPTENGNDLSPAAITSPPPPNTKQSHSRWPCKFEFKVIKPPMPRPSPAGQRKRKSRWDLRPEDP